LKSVTPIAVAHPVKLGLAAIVLVVVFATAFPAFAYFGYEAHGRAGISAAAVAAVVCLGAGLVALTFLGLFRKPQQAFTGVGLAMLFRMAIPMATGVVLTKLGGPLLKLAYSG